ncbi:MAG: DUF2282 domain-containing protein [Rhodocyclaceae bacterium]|nr:DUF2282 domain-containing protein [Rhodocyclaceae bacterium]
MAYRLANALVLGGAVGITVLALHHYSHWLPAGGMHFELARERCYGVVRAGRNDCGTALHACAGQAAIERGADEWLMVPAGTCRRIAGGRSWDEAG